MVWQRYLGESVTATPAVAAGRVFAVHSDDANPSDEEIHDGGWAITAMSLRDGRVLWRRRLDHDALDAVVATARDVFIATEDGRLRAFDAASGRERWRRDVGALGAPSLAGDSVELVSSPRASNGMRMTVRFRIVAPAENDRAARALIDLLQQHDLGACAWTGSQLVGVEVDHGQVRRLHSSDPGVRACLSSALGSSLPVGSDFTRADPAWRLHLDRGAEFVTELDRQSGRVIGRRTPEQVRTLPESPVAEWGAEGRRPAIVDRIAYEVVGGMLRAREVGSDVVRWSRPLDRRATQPAITRDAVVHGTDDGRIVVRERASGAIRKIFRIGAPIASQPIVADGWIYGTTSDGRVFGVRAGVAGRYSMWGGSPGH
jgi:outer membrane protein assembly factor BamB